MYLANYFLKDLKDSNLSVVEKRDSRSNSVTSNSSSGSSGSANSDYLSIKKSDSQVPLDVKKQRFKGKSRWSISNLDFSHKEVCSECSSTLGLTLRVNNLFIFLKWSFIKFLATISPMFKMWKSRMWL